MKQVLYLGPAEGLDAAQQVLRGAAQVITVATEPAAVTAALASVSAVLDASMKVPLTDAMIAASPHLQIISTATTGSDHIARGELDRRGIPVRTLREDRELLLNITPAAELSWALLMACARRLVPAVQHVRAAKWVREDFPGIMLNGKTLGVIGCGRIGQWMGRYARAFGMNVIGHDPFLTEWPDGIVRAPLADLVAQADFISVHVHLSDDTRGLVSADLIASMKPGAIFINTSRGAIANEAALLQALQSGRLAAAGLDVLDGEPDIADHPLLKYAQANDNLLITPHCGGLSPDAVRVVCARAAEKIRAALEQPS